MRLRHATWTCSIGMQHGHAAWTYRIKYLILLFVNKLKYVFFKCAYLSETSVFDSVLVNAGTLTRESWYSQRVLWRVGPTTLSLPGTAWTACSPWTSSTGIRRLKGSAYQQRIWNIKPSRGCHRFKVCHSVRVSISLRVCSGVRFVIASVGSSWVRGLTQGCRWFRGVSSSRVSVS
jgi:hypothetical protein